MEIQVQIQHNIGNVLTVSNDVASFARTYLTNNYTPATTQITVSNAVDFGTPGLVLMSVIGAENAEFVTASSLSNQTTISISSLLFSHTRGEQVSIADYDSIIVYKSATLTGTYTAFGTFNIQPTLQNTIITDPSGVASAYYKIQFRNSVSGNVSDFNTPTSASLYTQDSVAAMFNSVKRSFGISDTDPIITTEFLLNALNEARKFVDDTMANFKQSWREKFEFPIQLLAGWNRVYLPVDYDYKWTNNKLLSVRYPRINGLTPYPLSYVDKREWNTTAYSLKYSYLASPITAGDTTVNIQNIGDFSSYSNASSAGTIFVATNDLSQSIMQITYTGVDLVNNLFTGCTGTTRDADLGTQLFAFPTFSSATYYTVYEDYQTGNGMIVFNRPVPDIMQGRNIYIDYYTVMDPVTDINTVLQEPYKNIYSYYIRYAIKYRRDNSTSVNKNNPNMDPDYSRFTDLIQEWITNHYIGQNQKIVTR